MKMKKINKIAFIGMGLINSSLARDLNDLGFYNSSSAYSRTKKTRNILRKLDIVDKVEESYEKTVKGADIVIIGVPVAAFSNVIKKISPFLMKSTIITDVGSVKKSLIKSAEKYLPKNIDFIPGHPIAGTENSGPEAGFKGLFKNGYCILTPKSNIKKESLDIIIKMWNLAGMKVDIMDPEYHDMVLAITSHIPHIIAYSIVGTISNLEKSIKKEVIKYAASGFKDFTRIAASDPIMWRDILLSNKGSILEMLSIFKKDLATLERAIRNEDSKFLYNLFSKTRLIRKKINK
ncbi:MAG: Prephenate dehydrogenase [Alphaproteobacteria bacterium MarineAlpha9_Bin4]|nr:MAG: Prephenate dehydrogenase [Alphaproteobacteria bacterium MarineAlpha9_Bin4]|tara:strand:- start:200 stop:1072 length:873 start_codon:yes stop_codon:yes gene_type:complete